MNNKKDKTEPDQQEDNQEEYIHETKDAESIVGDQEVVELKKQVAEFKDQCLRAYAETENLRKRSEKEVSEARKFSISKVVEDLINVIESLYQSTEHISEEDKKNENVKKIVEGIELTRKELMTVLSKYQVKRLEPKLGDMFDHNFHQALSQAPDNKYPKNAITKVIRAGYLIEERLIKPALVMVSAGN